MRTYLLTSGILFLLLGVSHVYIAYYNMRKPESDTWSAVAPIVIAILGVGLGLWALRLRRQTPR